MVLDESIAGMGEKQGNWIKEKLDWLHHAYWIREFLLSSGIWSGVTIWAVKHAYISSAYKWPAIAILVGISMSAFAIIRGVLSKRKHPERVQNSASLTPGTQAETLPAGVDAKEFFRVAYRTNLEDEVRKNIRILAHHESPNDPEEFYLKFIGVGFVHAVSDNIWFSMFKSQLLALMELNRNNGLLPIAKMRAFYDKAAAEYPIEYAGDNFDRWMSFLTSNVLLKIHPSEMVEITVKGKDFLKFLTHWGRGPEGKRL